MEGINPMEKRLASGATLSCAEVGHQKLQLRSKPTQGATTKRPYGTLARIEST
jgi:hypothetical protein